MPLSLQQRVAFLPWGPFCLISGLAGATPSRLRPGAVEYGQGALTGMQAYMIGRRKAPHVGAEAE